MQHVGSLHEGVQLVREFLARLPDFPDWDTARFVEIGKGPRYEKFDGAYRWRIPRSALSDEATYRDRFEQLLGAGYSWINLSCYGILDGVAIIAIELPRETVGTPAGRTSVNVSGPPTDAPTDRVRWNGDGYLELVDD